MGSNDPNGTEGKGGKDTGNLYIRSWHVCYFVGWIIACCCVFAVGIVPFFLPWSVTNSNVLNYRNSSNEVGLNTEWYLLGWCADGEISPGLVQPKPKCILYSEEYCTPVGQFDMVCWHYSTHWSQGKLTCKSSRALNFDPTRNGTCPEHTGGCPNRVEVFSLLTLNLMISGMVMVFLSIVVFSVSFCLKTDRRKLRDGRRICLGIAASFTLSGGLCFIIAWVLWIMIFNTGKECTWDNPPKNFAASVGASLGQYVCLGTAGLCFLLTLFGYGTVCWSGNMQWDCCCDCCVYFCGLFNPTASEFQGDHSGPDEEELERRRLRAEAEKEQRDRRALREWQERKLAKEKADKLRRMEQGQQAKLEADKAEKRKAEEAQAAIAAEKERERAEKDKKMAEKAAALRAKEKNLAEIPTENQAEAKRAKARADKEARLRAREAAMLGDDDGKKNPLENLGKSPSIQVDNPDS